jgi:hypothetical protein
MPTFSLCRSGAAIVLCDVSGGALNAGRRQRVTDGLPAAFGRNPDPIPGSTVTVPDSSGLGDVFFNALGDHLIGTRTGTSEIDSFVVLPGGHLLAAKGSPFTGQGLGQLGAISASPYADGQTAPCWVEISHDGRYLFTVNTGSGNVSSYSIDPDGSLTLIGRRAAGHFGEGRPVPRRKPVHDLGVQVRDLRGFSQDRAALLG